MLPKDYDANLIKRAVDLYEKGVAVSVLSAAFGLTQYRFKQLLQSWEAEGNTINHPSTAIVVKRRKVQGQALEETVTWLNALPASQGAYVGLAVEEFYERYKKCLPDVVPYS